MYIDSSAGAETVKSADRPSDQNERAEGSLFEMMMGITPEEWDGAKLPESDGEDA